MVVMLEADDQCIASSNLGVELLGPLRLISGGTEFVPSARKDCALLAYLANSPETWHRRSRLAALLWPQSEDSRARESLKQALLRLRRCLPDELLESDRNAARLRVQRHQVDVTRLEDLLAESKLDTARRAAEQFTGHFLPELDDISSDFENWRAERQLALLDRVKQAALAGMKQSLALGITAQVEEIAERVSRLDPLDEEALRLLITAYASDRRYGHARRVFEVFRQRLHDEIGVEPEAATLALIDTLATEELTGLTELRSGESTPRIAVLTFEVGIDESSQRYFAEGLADDITTDLARNKALEVVPASSLTGLQGDITPVLLARGVTHVLSGRIRRGEGRLRVNTRLIDTRDRQIVWAERYDRDLEDVFDMQDAISSQIVFRLQLELSPEPASRARQGTRNAMAYDMFLKGRSLYLRGINNHSLRAAKALLQRSIEIDPEFARAHAQLAICESYLAMSIVNTTGEDHTALVLTHGQAALAMDPDLALGHAAVGLAHYAAGHYADAELALQRAVRIDANLFEAQFCLARNRHQQGDHEGAVHRFRLAAALRPEDFRSSGLLGDALKAIGSVLEANVAFAVSIERIETELLTNPDNAGALAFGAPILFDLGRADQALEWCAWALAIEPDDRLLRYNLARLFTMLGDSSTALEHLEAAYDAPPLVQRRLALWMRHDSDLAPLRHHPSYSRFVAFAGSVQSGYR